LQYHAFISILTASLFYISYHCVLQVSEKVLHSFTLMDHDYLHTTDAIHHTRHINGKGKVFPVLN